MSQPQPGELDHRRSQPRIAGLGHALFVIDRSALPRRRRQAGVGRHLSSIVKAAEQAFSIEDGGKLRADALQLRQHSLLGMTAALDPFRTSGMIEWPMPADIRSFEDLERFVP